MFKNIWLVFLISLLAACGGGETTVGSDGSSVDISPLNGKDGADGTSYASLIIPIICEDNQDGFEYQTGLDNNPKNGKLDNAEVTSRASICPPPIIIGWAQKLSYLKPSKNVCGGDPRGGLLFETWKDNDGNGKLNGNEIIDDSIQWCNGQQGAKGDTGAQGPDGLTPIFKTEKFYNSDWQSCSRLSIGYDTVIKNDELDLGTKEVVVSNTDCRDDGMDSSNIGLIFSHNFEIALKNQGRFKFVVTKRNPTKEFPLENPSILDITFIRITGIFKRPRPDGLVTVHFLKSELQCLVGDQDPRHIGKDIYSVICPAYGAYIPANENIKVIWQVGPRRNSFELQKIEIFGRFPTTTN